MKIFRHKFRVMGTPCELRFYPPATGAATSQANILVAEAQRLETKYSRYRADSLLTEINNSAGTGATLELDEETAGLLNYAATCHTQSQGLFDITSGVLRECWNFKDFNENLVLPTQRQITQLLQKSGWQKVQWQAPFLSLPIKGMQLDLGGVVKEYAADRMAALAQELGIQSGLIELGGDICMIGPHADGTPWTVGIRNPAKPEVALLALQLETGAMASSGTYERFLMIEGQRYHHILNPLTGWPVKGLISVTVLAQQCLVAGSAATIALLKEDKGIAWLQELGLPWLGVDEQGKLLGSVLEHTKKAI